MTRHRRLIRDARNFESKCYFHEQVYNIYRYNVYESIVGAGPKRIRIQIKDTAFLCDSSLVEFITFTTMSL